MDPVFRDEDAEDVLASFIRGPDRALDVTEWMNNSGEGDPELEIGRAHVWTPVTPENLVCRLLLIKNCKLVSTQIDPVGKQLEINENVTIH